MKKRTYVLIVALCMFFSQVILASSALCEYPYSGSSIDDDYDDDYYYDDYDYLFYIGKSIGEQMAGEHGNNILDLLFSTLNDSYAMIPTCNMFLYRFGYNLSEKYQFLYKDLLHMANSENVDLSKGIQYEKEISGKNFRCTITLSKNDLYLNKIEIHTTSLKDLDMGTELFFSCMRSIINTLSLVYDNDMKDITNNEVLDKIKVEDIIFNTCIDTKASYTKNAFKYTFERDDQDGFKFTAENIFN